MQLERGDFPNSDEEKVIGDTYNSSGDTSSSDGDDSSGVIEVSDTEVTDTALESWQNFYKPEAPPLDPKVGSKRYRLIRWTIFTTYRRLFAFCFIANAIALIVLGATKNLTSQHTASATAINLLVAILARHEHVVNVLFRVSSAVPVSWPLWFRKKVAKIYCYGGWHSGCSISAFVWYAVFVGYATRDYCRGETNLLPSIILAYILVVVFLLIIVFAHPKLRMKYHDYFELTHRFAGYISVGIFWAQVLLMAHAAKATGPTPHSMGHNLIHLPAFWCLLIITATIIYPWLRLRKRQVAMEYLSSHAVQLHFYYTALDYCIGVRLTTRPLFETHSFATIPNRPGERPGFSVIISNAGDWTSKLIQSAKLDETATSSQPTIEAGVAPTILPGPTGIQRSKKDDLRAKKYFWNTIYVKGAPIYGVLRVATIFRKPVIVTTGSGIGPCMSLLNGRPYHGTDWQCRVLWATKNPVKTYGQDLVNDVRRADPNARIVDTGVEGRPNMVELAWQLYKDRTDYRGSWIGGPGQTPEGEAPEAVIVISNPKVTRKVVYGLECRGVPAYGVIFDS